ncbi:MAG: ATP-binding cassette domain-containing protein [Gammaproteobacteria bacterium]|nr:ATP-binding cassette domain-containing protein [Gammaproteobacteria bacterium]
MASLTLIQFQSRILNPIDLVVAAGECVTLAGPSGCGKSLLLRALADLDAHSGEAMIGEQHQSTLPPPDWRKRVGMLPAESHWWADRVRDHFSSVDAELLEFLGFNTECLDWSIARLSSGERQRLSLARLLSGHPEALLLDEPTANLDEGSGRRLESLITTYRREHDTAVIWVSHDPKQRERIANRAFLIEGQTLRPETWS